MEDGTILKTGMIGSVIAAICCFTPALVLLLGALGLSAWLGWLDYVLQPVYAFKGRHLTWPTAALPTARRPTGTTSP